MEPTPWNPWRELESLQGNVNELWESFLTKLSHLEGGKPPIGFLPSVDFIETREDYRVFLSAPGLIEHDIDLSVEREMLTVRGERQRPYDPQHHQTRMAECRYGFFERQIALPGPIEPSTVKAAYEAGILMIVLRKTPAPKDSP